MLPKTEAEFVAEIERHGFDMQHARRSVGRDGFVAIVTDPLVSHIYFDPKPGRLWSVHGKQQFSIIVANRKSLMDALETMHSHSTAKLLKLLAVWETWHSEHLHHSDAQTHGASDAPY